MRKGAGQAMSMWALPQPQLLNEQKSELNPEIHLLCR